MIEAIDTSRSVEWDKIVTSFSEHDVYYLSGYVRAFELNGDGQALLIYFEDQDRSTRAVNIVIKRDISLFAPFRMKLQTGRCYDIATPYGYGGWLIEGDAIHTLKAEYEEWAEQNGIVSEFVRFHPMLDNHCELIYQDINLGDTVFIDTSSEGRVWDNLSSKNRNMIRKAKKAGQEVFWCRDPRIIDTFMEIYNATMDKDRAGAYYYFKKDFYESILMDLKGNALWFYSMKEDVVTAIAILLFCNGKAHYHLSAFREAYRSFAPTNLLLYEAALWACRSGCKTLHLGGGVGARHDTLYSFKKGFNRGGDAEFHIGKKIFDKEKYEELMRLRSKEQTFDEETTFFPGYRLRPV